MPHFRIETNVLLSAIKEPDEFKKSLSTALSKFLKKPESYIIVTLVPGVDMIMGGNNDPCASATLMSIGGLGIQENKEISSFIYPLLEKHLGVVGTRAYIDFRDVERANVGFNGGTFY